MTKPETGTATAGHEYTLRLLRWCNALGWLEPALLSICVGGQAQRSIREGRQGAGAWIPSFTSRDVTHEGTAAHIEVQCSK
jgi:hypothetical protein